MLATRTALHAVSPCVSFDLETEVCKSQGAMGRKGWAGAPPADDAEARKRIIDATLRLVDGRGAEHATLSDVADSLGITRRTVYRYFAGTEELFTAVAEIAMNGFVAQVEVMTADMDA